MKKLLMALCVVPGGLVIAEDKFKRTALDEAFLDDSLWTTSLADLKKAYEPKKEAGEDESENEIPREIRIRLTEGGFDIDSIEESGALQWLSAQKRGLRSPGGFFTLLGKDIGEVVVRGTEEATSNVTISIFNRGDDGVLAKTKFLEELNGWKDALDKKLGVRPDVRKKAGAVAVQGWLWRKGSSAYLLEGSITRKDNRAEFIRLRIAPLDGAGKEAKAVRRSLLVKRVKKLPNGDVLIPQIPMVDQGQKGYCVVATVERVGRYFGLDVDQHELAQLANTDEDGTSGEGMEKAFKKLTGKIHVRTIKLVEYSNRQFEQDYKSYNRAAKKEGVHVFKEDLDEWIVDPRYFWSRADKSVFKAVKAKQSKYDFFNSKIRTYIDQGVPVCWTLYLGMFPEKGTPQSWGGHMRLIIGYNKEKEEIIYSDSWGEGHALKRMSAVEAWCMNMALYAMVPNR